MLLEAKVHAYFRILLRDYHQVKWQHQLTMGRLVARTLRLKSSVLIQTNAEVSRYSFSYLIPALLSLDSVILVLPQSLQPQILEEEIPLLQKWLNSQKEIITDDFLNFYHDSNQILIVSPQTWLADSLFAQNLLPNNLTVFIDQADQLENWALEELTIDITPEDWRNLLSYAPAKSEIITTVLVKITQTLFNHPKNPYESYQLNPQVESELAKLCEHLVQQNLLSEVFLRFWHQWRSPHEQILWASLDRNRGKFDLHLAPISASDYLAKIWSSQSSHVIMGQFLDQKPLASTYRAGVGLKDILYLNFASDRNSDLIQLYSPERFPFPNTPEFQGILTQQIKDLVNLANYANQQVVILITDTPLKAQIAASLAAEFGSNVQVEKTDLSSQSILVAGWDFWLTHQQQLFTPQLLIMSTLPIPSLEHPVVASRVTYYKRKRQDWFRSYLLPTAIRNMQKAIIPLRKAQGVVAILDNRVNYRSYGNDILNALEPCARISHITLMDLSSY